MDEFDYRLMVKDYGYIEPFLELPYFMFGYARTFFVIGLVAGYFLLPTECHLHGSPEAGGS